MNFGVFTLVFCSLMSASLRADQVRIALDTKPGPQVGGYYAALQLGFFREKGVNVVLLEGSSETAAINLLKAGQAEYAVTSAEEVILAHDQGNKEVIALFSTYQISPLLILTHADQSFGFLEDVFKSKGFLLWQESLPATRYLTKRYGPFKVKTLPILAGDFEKFQKDPKTSQLGLVTAIPLLSQKGKIPLKAFLLADAGYNPYTSVLVTRPSRLRGNSLEAQKMVQALRAGWRSYQKDPGRVSLFMAGLNKSLDLATITAGSEAQKSLVAPQPQLPDKFGTMELYRWETLINQLLDLKLIKSKPRATDLFQNL